MRTNCLNMKRIIVILVLGLMYPLVNYGQSEDDIAKGLKEALTVGTNNGVLKANKKDGYYKDSRLKIPFPPDAEFVRSKVHAIPVIGPKYTDTLVLKLNRAAEKAAIKAKPIFIDAISKMTLTDAGNILSGGNDAATQYLKKQSYNNLANAFKPDIQKSLEEVGAQKAWKDVTENYNKVTFFNKKKINTDLAQYTTQKALDGLFILIADEESKIRKDPEARVTDILKSIFGH